MDDSTDIYMDLKPGTGLNGGKYVIENKIGEGGFSITYKAVQKGLNRAVCIKEYFLAGRCVRNTQTHTVQLQGISEDLFEKYRAAFQLPLYAALPLSAGSAVSEAREAGFSMKTELNGIGIFG